MPKRLEILWEITERILSPEGEYEDKELEESLGLIERELSYLEAGLADPGNPCSQLFIKAILNDLNPAFAYSWEMLSNSHRERLQSIRMRALRLSLRQRKDSGAVNPQSLDDVKASSAQAS